MLFHPLTTRRPRGSFLCRLAGGGRGGSAGEVRGREPELSSQVRSVSPASTSPQKTSGGTLRNSNQQGHGKKNTYTQRRGSKETNTRGRKRTLVLVLVLFLPSAIRSGPLEPREPADGRPHDDDSYNRAGVRRVSLSCAGLKDTHMSKCPETRLPHRAGQRVLTRSVP